MWETLFDPSMLGGPKEIAIWCPSEDAAIGLLTFLESKGVVWSSGVKPLSDPKWKTYQYETVYFVSPCMELTYCDRKWAQDECYNYLLCIFAGILPMMEPIELEDLL